MNKIHLQGDIQLEPCKKPVEKVQEIKHNGEFVLALGETTGHSHRVKVAEPPQMVVVKDKEGNVYLQFLGEGILTHEEHGTHIITPGWYKFNREQEFDYFQNFTRKVVD